MPVTPHLLQLPVKLSFSDRIQECWRKNWEECKEEMASLNNDYTKIFLLAFCLGASMYAGTLFIALHILSANTGPIVPIMLTLFGAMVAGIGLIYPTSLGIMLVAHGVRALFQMLIPSAEEISRVQFEQNRLAYHRIMAMILEQEKKGTKPREYDQKKTDSCKRSIDQDPGPISRFFSPEYLHPNLRTSSDRNLAEAIGQSFAQ